MLKKILLILFVLLIYSTSFGAKPDPVLTPGKICTASDPDFERYRYPEKIPYCTRNVSIEEKMFVAKNYGNIPRSEWSNYEFDHLIPLSMGGANDSTNIWPEPIFEAKEKDKLELFLYKQLSNGSITQKDAVSKMLNWVENNYYDVKPIKP